MIATEYDEAYRAVPYVRTGTPEERVAARQAYTTAVARIEANFALALSEEYGTGTASIDRLIYAQAWADGHSSGYHEVEGRYIDLVEYTQQVINLATNGAA